MKKRPPIDNAARALQVIYEGLPWFHVVGIASPDTLIVYRRPKWKPHPDQTVEEFVGYKVEFKVLGTPRVGPATTETHHDPR